MQLPNLANRSECPMRLLDVGLPKIKEQPAFALNMAVAEK